MAESEALRRSDLDQFLNFLSILLGNRPGQPAQGSDRTGQYIAAIGSIAAGAAAASASRFKEGIEPVSDDAILTAIRNLPVYEWSYKGDRTRHVGPMAEDFHAAFGVGSGPDAIHYIDAIGALMASTKALASKVEALEAAA